MYKFTYTTLSHKYNSNLKYNFSKSFNYLKYKNNENNKGINKFLFNINLTKNIKIYSNKDINITNKYLLYPIIDITKNIKSKTNYSNFKCNVYQIRYFLNNATNVKINRIDDDFVAPLILINSSNIDNISTNIYTKKYRKIDTVEIQSDQYILLNNRELLYNFENVNYKINDYNFENIGFLDILQVGISINT